MPKGKKVIIKIEHHSRLHIGAQRFYKNYDATLNEHAIEVNMSTLISATRNELHNDGVRIKMFRCTVHTERVLYACVVCNKYDARMHAYAFLSVHILFQLCMSVFLTQKR